MKMIEELEVANQAPLFDRSLLRGPVITVAHAVIMLFALVVICYGLMLEGEMRYIALIGVAPAVAIVLIWPLMEAFGFHQERGFTGYSGVDAAIASQMIGLAIIAVVYATMKGANASLILLIPLVVPAMMIVRRKLDATSSEQTALHD